jgi:hypothetical protein
MCIPWRRRCRIKIQSSDMPSSIRVVWEATRVQQPLCGADTITPGPCGRRHVFPLRISYTVHVPLHIRSSAYSCPAWAPFCFASQPEYSNQGRPKAGDCLAAVRSGKPLVRRYPALHQVIVQCCMRCPLVWMCDRKGGREAGRGHSPPLERLRTVRVGRPEAHRCGGRAVRSVYEIEVNGRGLA